MRGISSASFYAAFVSKEALYRETLDAYLRGHGMVMAALREESLSPRDRLEQALRRFAVMQTEDDHPTGCMVTLSATICSADAFAVRSLTAAERAANREAIRACVDTAIADGTLRHETDPIGLAALFNGLLVGLSIQARDGVSSEQLNAAVTQVLRAWDANSSASGGVGSGSPADNRLRVNGRRWQKRLSTQRSWNDLYWSRAEAVLTEVSATSFSLGKQDIRDNVQQNLLRGINPMDQDRTKDESARRSGITWGGGRRRSNLTSDRWHDSYTSQGPDWLRGPTPAVRDYGPSYEVTTIWGKALVVAAASAVLVAMFVL